MVSIEGKNFFAIDKNVYYKQKENMDSGKSAVYFCTVAKLYQLFQRETVPRVAVRSWN